MAYLNTLRVVAECLPVKIIFFFLAFKIYRAKRQSFC